MLRPSTLNLEPGTWNFLHHFTHAPQVVFRVHADGGRGGFDDADRVAAFEDAELFERLGAFERGLGPARELQQKGAAVDVKPRVLPKRREQLWLDFERGGERAGEGRGPPRGEQRGAGEGKGADA